MPASQAPLGTEPCSICGVKFMPRGIRSHEAACKAKAENAQKDRAFAANVKEQRHTKYFGQTSCLFSSDAVKAAGTARVTTEGCRLDRHSVWEIKIQKPPQTSLSPGHYYAHLTGISYFAIPSTRFKGVGSNPTAVTKWRRSLRSEGREVGVGSVRPGGGRGIGRREAARRKSPRDDVRVLQHPILGTEHSHLQPDALVQWGAENIENELPAHQIQCFRTLCMFRLLTQPELPKKFTSVVLSPLELGHRRKVCKYWVIQEACARRLNFGSWKTSQNSLNGAVSSSGAVWCPSSR
ncbi:hypothetical protein B0H14DRAFT_3128321 [Mycena olivaceomarginata]|nr:hypothetical protein B0H14DRAFT_3128321 [Mycena olivaceomarginata]